jgi:4-oxalocrotonate tautomerase
MPIAHITIQEGRSQVKKASMIAAVTDALSETLNAPRETIRVIIHEVPPEHWGIAGTPASERNR